MKLNYWVGGFVIVVILFLNSPGLTQQTENRRRQGGVNESQPHYVIGLQINAAPISYRESDNNNNRDNFTGYCNAFIETLKQNYKLNIRPVSVFRKHRFTGKGENQEKLDAVCGPDTITIGRQNNELKEHNLDGEFSHPFAWTSIAVLLKKKNQDNFLHRTLEQELKIGVLKGTTTREVVNALYPLHFNKIEVDNEFEEAFKKLENGDIIAYYDDEILLRDRLQKKYSKNPEKKTEYILLHIPSIIEYGIVVFHINEKKNAQLLQDINNFLENAQQDSFDSITVKKLENNEYFQNFISRVKQKIPEDNLIEPIPSPSPSPSSSPNSSPIQRYLWFLVFFVIIIIGVIWCTRRNCTINFKTLFSKNQTTTKPKGQKFDTADRRDIHIRSGNYAESIHGHFIQGNYYAAGQPQTLAEVAAEIQQLLNQLKETNPTETETVIAAKAADEIKNNPTLKTRVLGEMKSGDKETFKKAVNNQLVNILIAIIEGWQEAQ